MLHAESNKKSGFKTIHEAKNNAKDSFFLLSTVRGMGKLNRFFSVEK